MAHVFISYNRRDSAFAQELHDRLVAAGIPVWMDQLLHAGDDWRTEIDLAIREAFALVVIVTDAARQSPYVTYEWACAWGANVRVLPVMLEHLDNLHPRLATLHHRDFTDPDHRPFEQLIGDLRHFQEEHEAQRQHQHMPRAVQQAFEELEHYRQDARLQALDGLARMQHPAALEALRQAANTGFHADVRMIAALRVVQRTPERCADVLPRLQSALEDDSPALRSEALDALRRVRDPEAVPDLVALHDHHGDTVRAAVDAVITGMGGEAVPGLMVLLRDGDDAVQQTVARMLIQIGDPAVPLLEDALRHDHTAMRFIAAHILGEIGNPDVVPAMIEIVDHADIHLKRLLVYALGRLNDPRAIPALITRLDDRDMQTVAATVEALGRLRAQDAVPALCHVVHRPEPTLKLAAVQVLGRLGDNRAAPTLIEALDTYPDPQFQMAVVEALGQLDAPDALAALSGMVHHENPTLRRAVVRALSAHSTPGSVPGLCHAIHDPDPQIAHSAAAALIALADREQLVAIVRAARELPVESRRALVERLSTRGAEAVPALLHAITDVDLGVCRVASGTLAGVGNREALEGLLDLLRGNYPEDLLRVFVDALKAIQHEGALYTLVTLLPEAGPTLRAVVHDVFQRRGLLAAGPLLEMLDDAQLDAALRPHVIELLGYTHSDDAIDALNPLLSAPDVGLRRAAVVALGRLEAYEVVPQLIAMLYTDADAQVRAEVEVALERIGTDTAINALRRWRSPGSTSPLRRLDEQDHSAPWLRNRFNIPPHEDRQGPLDREPDDQGDDSAPDHESGPDHDSDRDRDPGPDDDVPGWFLD